LAVALRLPGARLRTVAVMTAVTLLVLAPWLGRNWAAFDRVLLSTNGGLTAMIANCEGPYYEDLGFIEPNCLTRCQQFREEELPYADCGTRVARRYAEDHLERVPVVLAARAGRTWNVYGLSRDLDYAEFGGRDRRVGALGLAFYFALLPLAVLGAWVLRRRGRPLLPLLAPLVVATLATAVTFGFSQYRVGADVALVVLGATGLEALVARVRG
jgi:hypothetical protein